MQGGGLIIWHQWIIGGLCNSLGKSIIIWLHDEPIVKVFSTLGRSGSNIWLVLVWQQLSFHEIPNIWGKKIRCLNWVSEADKLQIKYTLLLESVCYFTLRSTRPLQSKCVILLILKRNSSIKWLHFKLQHLPSLNQACQWTTSYTFFLLVGFFSMCAFSLNMRISVRQLDGSHQV